MSQFSPPADPAAAVSWLIDRAAIADLFLEYARGIDERDWEAFGAVWAQDAVIALDGGFTTVGRDTIVATTKGFEFWAATHHVTTNIQIGIDGDEAVGRAYVIATHVLDAASPGESLIGGGTYRCRFTRTADGWRYSRVDLSGQWRNATGRAAEVEWPPKP